MLPSSTRSSPADRNENHSSETLSQLRVKICSVRLPSSTKLVDISVTMEVDNKYTYRTEVIRKKARTTPPSLIIPINESFDILVTSNSKIKLKILAPTRLFGNNDLGQLQFAIKTILDEYCSSEQTENKNDVQPSYSAKLSFENSNSSSSTLRANETNNNSNGMVEIIFYGSLLKQQHERNKDRTEQVKSISTISIIRFSFCVGYPTLK